MFAGHMCVCVCTQAAARLCRDASSAHLLEGILVLMSALKDLLCILETLAYKFLCFGQVGMLNLDV